MARIGGLFLAGSDEFEGEYPCGISYSLSSRPLHSHTYKTSSNDWQVEFIAGSPEVVARTRSQLSLEKLQLAGFAAIQEALDILSVKGIYSACLTDPARSYVAIYHSNGNSVLRTYNLFDFSFGGGQEHIIHRDRFGNEIPPALPLEPTWNESFRYYRLSQTSTDYFEAYRNLFLGFEAILNHVCPKKSKEKEGPWLKRSLSHVNREISLAALTPRGVDDPVEYIITSQYKQIRCNLQHAKFPKARLAHSAPSPGDVKLAYSNLIRIWRKIAGAYLNLPAGSCIIPCEGFADVLGKIFSGGADVYYSQTPAIQYTENPAGHNKLPINRFSSASYAGQVQPGVVRVHAKENATEKLANPRAPVHKICFGFSGKIIDVAYIESGLIITGVDQWESIIDIQLINASEPKTIFRT